MINKYENNINWECYIFLFNYLAYWERESKIYLRNMKNYKDSIVVVWQEAIFETDYNYKIKTF